MGESSRWKKLSKMKSKIVDGRGLKIGIVAFRDIMKAYVRMRWSDGADSRFVVSVMYSDGVLSVQLYVPGALEIPLAVKRLAESKEETFDAIIALGLRYHGVKLPITI